MLHFLIMLLSEGKAFKVVECEEDECFILTRLFGPRPTIKAYTRRLSYMSPG